MDSALAMVLKAFYIFLVDPLIYGRKGGGLPKLLVRRMSFLSSFTHKRIHAFVRVCAVGDAG